MMTMDQRLPPSRRRRGRCVSMRNNGPFLLLPPRGKTSFSRSPMSLQRQLGAP